MIDYINKNPITVFVGILIFLGVSFGIGEKLSENKAQQDELDRQNSHTKALIATYGPNYAYRVDSINKVQEQKRIESTYSKKAIKLHKKHPEWSYDDCENLVNKKVWIGMSRDMLYYLRGKPDRVNSSNYGRGNNYQLVWDDYEISNFYTDDTGLISAWN